MYNISNAKNYQPYKPSRLTDFFSLQDYVVLDVETTGLSPKTDKIIEISIVRVSNGTINGRFSSLVNPGRNLPSRIISLTGLTDAMLENAPAFSAIAKDVKAFIGKSVVLAHNAPFDLNFLSEAFRQCNIKCRFQYLDTVKLSRMAYPGLQNYKLETLISELDLAKKQSHRAMDDVQCTLKLYQLICEKLGDPYIRALVACCHPIEAYQLSYKSSPLKGLRFALLGEFTFTYSAAKKLISAAGGTVVDLKNPNVDYLVYGFIEPTDIVSEHEKLVQDAIKHGNKARKPEPINEVELLRLCGVTFF